MKNFVNNNIKQNNHSIGILAIAIFMISPVLSLPFILLSIYNKERLGLISLALFGAILSYALLPTRDLDLSRYYLLYHKIEIGGFRALKQILLTQNDYLFFYIYYIFTLLKIPFQVTLFILSFIGGYSCLYIYDKIIREYKVTKLDYFFLTSVFVLSLPILAQLSVTRFYIGFIFFIWFVYFWYKKNKVKYLLCLFFACVTHFAFVVFIPPIILFFFVKNRNIINISLIILICLVILLNIKGNIISYFQYLPIISKKAEIYSEIYADVKAPILSYSLLGSIFIITIFYFFYKKYFDTKLLQIFLAMYIIVLITIPFNIIIYDRYIQIFKPIAMIVIAHTCLNSNANKFKKLRMRLFVFALYLPFIIYYIYTFVAIYSRNYQGFLSLGNLLLMNILGSTYTEDNIIR